MSTLAAAETSVLARQAPRLTACQLPRLWLPASSVDLLLWHDVPKVSNAGPNGLALPLLTPPLIPRAFPPPPVAFLQTVEDLLLWHDVPKSAAAVSGATLLYVLLEWSGIPLLTWLSNVCLVVVIGCALWAFGARFMNR